jgi:5-methylcytosine-specific restriction protein A
MITDKTFQDAVLRYKAEESRGSFYDIAVNLFNKGFRTEAYLLLLATWNFASFRYAVTNFDLMAFEHTVNSLETHFLRLDGKDIRTADFDSLQEDISVIYNTLSQIKGIKYTGAPKMMHLRNRELFVMWDGYIRGQKPRKNYEGLDIVKRGDWDIKEYGDSADDYLQYLKHMQGKFAGIPFSEQGKTFAKAIDEFNYVSVTLPIQRAEKAASQGGTEAPATAGADDQQSVGIVNTETFRKALQRVFAESPGSFVDVTSRELYRSVGGRTGRDYKMAPCCNVMTKAMRPGDTVLAKPPKGRGATLKIRYLLPR